MSSWRSRNVRSPWRTTAWSSATSDADHARHLQPHRRARAGRESIQRPAERARPLLHRRQAQPPRAQLGASGSKPAPSSVDLSTQPAVAAVEPHVDARRRPRGAARCRAPPGRSGRPRRRTLAARGAARRRLAARSSAPVHAAQHLDVLAQRARQPLAPRASAGRSSKISERSSSIASRASSLHALQLRRAPASGRARAACAAASAASTTPNSFWRDRVVQLAREPVALLDDRQLAAALVQPRVLDRDRGVRGEQLDQLLVGVRRTPAPSFSVR